MWQCYWHQKITLDDHSSPSPAFETPFRVHVVPVHLSRHQFSMHSDAIRWLAAKSRGTHFPDKSSLTPSEKINGGVTRRLRTRGNWIERNINLKVISRRDSIASSLSSIPAYPRRQSVHHVIMEESETSFSRKSNSTLSSVKTSYDV